MVAFDGVVRLVDPDFAGDFGWPGSTVGEALRMPAVGVIKDVLPRCLEFIGQAMVDGVGGEQPQAAVTVFRCCTRRRSFESKSVRPRGSRSDPGTPARI